MDQKLGSRGMLATTNKKKIVLTNVDLSKAFFDSG